ncbi:MAG: AAA family ATPase [Ignavibacteria bacterium]|nr:AAA family ATPase [Ignavibacteria bacterium]
MKDKVIISICGAAGAGKSTLAKKLAEAIGYDMACRIPVDYFLKSYNGEPYEEFMNTPFKFDWTFLKKVISVPINSRCETPDFDFNKLIRISRTGGIQLTLRRYIILDSLPCPFADHLIRLDAPEDLRKSRIKDRDKKDKTNSFRNWQKMEVTAKELELGKYKYDLVLSGFDEPEANALKITEYLNI